MPLETDFYLFYLWSYIIIKDVCWKILNVVIWKMVLQQLDLVLVCGSATLDISKVGFYFHYSKNSLKIPFLD